MQNLGLSLSPARPKPPKPTSDALSDGVIAVDGQGHQRTPASRWTHRRAHFAEALALAGVLALSAALRLIWLDREAYGNTYYAAAVLSMLQNWRAFFFASFDAGGFVTVDKPPVGLWTQVLSARLLGFNGMALLLP